MSINFNRCLCKRRTGRLNVGPTCIRINYWNGFTANGISLIAEDPATNANINLSKMQIILI